MFNLELSVSGSQYLLTTAQPLNSLVLEQFPKYTKEKISDNEFLYTIYAGPNAAFILTGLIAMVGDSAKISEDVKARMDKDLKLINPPEVFMYDDNRIGLESPNIPYYHSLMTLLTATQQSPSIWTIPAGRTYEAIRMLKVHKGFLPTYEVKDDVRENMLSPFDSFDGTVSSLYSADISELMSVTNAYRTTIENFNKVGYETIADFLVKKPRRHIDKTAKSEDTKWSHNEEVILIGKITDNSISNYKHTKLDINFNGRPLTVMFYNREWINRKYRVGDEVLIMGRFDRGNKITGVSIDTLMEAESLPIVPVYPESAKNNINSAKIINIIYEIFSRLEGHATDMFSYLDTSKFGMTIQQAIQIIHFPESLENYKTALDVLAFAELFFMQVLILDRKNSTVRKKGQSKPHVDGGLADMAINGLPFDLTDGQKEALLEVDKTLSSKLSEEMLISADVGSGKTIVAQLACLQVVDNGYQAVLAGPTEVLSKQLYETFIKLIEGIPNGHRPNIAYLGGGMRVKAKRELYEAIEHGDIDIIVGTHAALSEKVPYKKLGLVCVDEEQKFGAGQRTNLLVEDANGSVPDSITQTATPIPRSTSQVYYGDINFVTIDQKPSGRLPIITEWIKTDPTKFTKKKKSPVWDDIRAEAELGHKTFIVVPMVNESERVNASSVKGTVADLQKVLPDLEIEFLHGQMKKAEQEQALDNFKNGSANVLVASTVIEVGVDVPEATRILILSAERMGASSLHQIRGRVGRNSLQSKCYLVSDTSTVSGESRLNSLVESNDGFYIATVDLQTRGAGDLFGEKQSGDTHLNFATLVDHSYLIEEAQKQAKKIYNTPRKYEAIADAEAVLKSKSEE